jgi:hypothetical protein
VLSLHAARLSTNGTQINNRLLIFGKWFIRRVLTVETLLQSLNLIRDNRDKRLRQSVRYK